jgi:hypothetical protein
MATGTMIIKARATPADELQVAREVTTVLERRGALPNPPASLAVSDAVALGIAGIFAGPTASGQVLDRFYRSGAADAETLIEAARFEQGYASPEGHAALHCLIGWARSRTQRTAQYAGAR